MSKLKGILISKKKHKIKQTTTPIFDNQIWIGLLINA